MSDKHIVQEYNDLYQEAYYAWNPFYPLAERDLRFYLGNQWDEQERQKLFSEGRSAFVFNRARRNLNLITGYQRKNRLSSVVSPVESSDQKTADQLSKLLLYVMQNGDGYNLISESFGGAIKTGFNLCTVWVDYTDDPINGDIKFGREPYSGFITDPYFTRLDFSDCSHVMRRKYISADQAASLLPGHEKDIYSLQKMGWSRDDKFTWLPYQRQPNGADYVAYNEFYKQKWKKVPVIVDMETGEYIEWKGSSDSLKEFQARHPQLQVIKQPRKYIENHIIINDEYIKTEINPNGLDEYPFVPFVGIFEPESDQWELKVQSLMRCMIDPQREANRRRSQMTDLLDSQINSGWIANENSVINPRSLFQTSQGKVIWKREDSPPDAVVKIPPAQIPPSMFQLQETFDRDMVEILGINEAAFGVPESGNESGVMMMLRQGAAITNLQDVFDNLRFAQRHLSKKVLKLIQNWSPEKVKRIINEEPTKEFYDKDFDKYDVSVQEGVLSDSQKLVYFRQLVDLKQITDSPAGSPITASMLVEAAPIQNKSELNEQIAKNEKQQAQQAQEAQQKQDLILGSQLEMNKAKSISDISLSKERFTRAVANMGLQEERNAEAVQNRAQAALDRTKAMKEIESMSDDRLVKYLQIVERMEAKNKQDEMESKSDDVAITEASERLNAAFPSEVTPQQETIQQQ